MRENRLYGSEGGEVKSLPYPYHLSTGLSLDAFTPPVLKSRLPRSAAPADMRVQPFERAAAELWIASLRRNVRAVT